MAALYAKEDAVLEIPETGLVMLDFWAPWNNLSQVECILIADLAETYMGKVGLLRVNVDEHPAVAAQYRVCTVPTLLLIEAGQVIERFVGRSLRRKVRRSIEQAIERQQRLGSGHSVTDYVADWAQY